jgi:hypothetical protein
MSETCKDGYRNNGNNVVILKKFTEPEKLLPIHMGILYAVKIPLDLFNQI